MVNVLWYQSSDAITDGPGAASAIVGQINTSIKAGYLAVLTTNSFYLGCQVSLNLAGVVYNAGSAGGAEPGLVAGDEAPDYCAVVMQKRSQLPGRSGRGRLFIGGVPESFTDTSTLTEDALVTYQSLAEAFSGALNLISGIFMPAHLSELTNQMVPIQQWTPQEVLATQRRRRLRPGF